MHGRNPHHGRSREPWFTGIYIRPILYGRQAVDRTAGASAPGTMPAPYPRGGDQTVQSVPQTERTRFCRYTVPREAERACLMGGGDPPTFRGTLLAPCGSTVARNSILAEVDKSCKREEKIFLRRSKEQRYNPYPFCHTRTHTPPRVRCHGTVYPPQSCHATA